MYHEFPVPPPTAEDERLKAKKPERVGYVRFIEGHRRAQEVIAKKMKGRDLDDFVDGKLYTKDAIEKAKKHVAAKEAQFAASDNEGGEAKVAEKKRRKMMADCLEAIFLYTRSWFGATTRLFPTNKWDDVVNKVDMVAERTDGDLVAHHGFALDITYGGVDVILKKMRRFAKGIKEGKLGKVDFFRTVDEKTGKETFKGGLQDIPLVVIGADENTMKGLINMFADGQAADKNLGEHPFQFQMIDQIMQQCDFYIELAKKCYDKARSAKMIEAYTQLRDSFIPVLKLKDKLLPGVDKNYRDDFHANMERAMHEVRIDAKM